MPSTAGGGRSRGLGVGEDIYLPQEARRTCSGGAGSGLRGLPAPRTPSSAQAPSADPLPGPPPGRSPLTAPVSPYLCKQPRLVHSSAHQLTPCPLGSFPRPAHVVTAPRALVA